jgi:hypothetical protein
MIKLQRNYWTGLARGVVFVLAASSIWCLLAEFYGLCSMRTFTLWVSLPALGVLGTLALADLSTGTGQLWRSVVLGTLAGLAAACSYDVFRLPFVFAPAWHLDRVVPHLPLFKVFPLFGAMILGQDTHAAAPSLPAQIVGWTYHFSNGATFGIMYLALIGDPRRRHWIWAVVLAVGLELGMLFTPYPSFFGIAASATFVAVTLAAHLIFGVVLGLLVRASETAPPELALAASG